MERDGGSELRDEERTVCEVWTRVMSYYRPTSAFNKGKQSEYSERVCFSESKTATTTCS
jgi:anaerobic ribonucleoside-triphosphate reductase